MFDNADVNVQTLTGLGRWHALGGIACVFPSNTNSYEMVVVRCTEIRSFVQVGIFAQISSLQKISSFCFEAVSF